MDQAGDCARKCPYSGRQRWGGARGCHDAVPCHCVPLWAIVCHCGPCCAVLSYAIVSHAMRSHCCATAVPLCATVGRALPCHCCTTMSHCVPSWTMPHCPIVCHHVPCHCCAILCHAVPYHGVQLPAIHQCPSVRSPFCEHSTLSPGVPSLPSATTEPGLLPLPSCCWVYLWLEPDFVSILCISVISLVSDLSHSAEDVLVTKPYKHYLLLYFSQNKHYSNLFINHFSNSKETSVQICN